MKITKLPNSNYGIIIDDFDFNQISVEEWIKLGKLHLDNLVTIIRGKNCTVDIFSDLIHIWGPEFWGLKYSLLQKYKMDWSLFQAIANTDLPIIENIDKDILSILYKSSITSSNGKTINFFSSAKDENGNFGLYGGQELDWHMHSSGNYVFEPCVSLFAAENVKGTATGFVKTVDYYENISESFRSELEDMVVLHKYISANVDPPFRPAEEQVLKFKMCPIDDTPIPMIVQSPGGIKGLHFSPPTFSKIKDATDKESKQIFDKITTELFSEKYIYDHWYEGNGDVCIFDNSITLHRRVGQSENRKIYRIEHTYDNLLTEFYEPFLQKEFAKKHRQMIKKIIKLEKTGFIKPKFILTDYL